MTSNAAGVIGYLNKSRLAPYELHSRDDHETRALYLWNIELSAAFQEVLAITEVALRNAIDDAFGAWNVTKMKPDGQFHPATWLSDPAAPLMNLTAKTRFGLHRTYVGSVERGERNISLLNILTLATVLDVDPGSLVTGMTRPPAEGTAK